MGLLSDLASGGIKGIVGGVADAVDRFVETPDEAAAHALKEKALDLSVAMKQMEVNQTEAAHRSIWVSGWRPAVGWVCAAALAYSFIVQPALIYVLAVWSPATPPPPGVDLAGLWPVLLGMLGLGTLRTYEKKQGVAK